MSVRRQPVQERSSETVQQILDAASSLLGRVPVEQITTSRVASEAGVSIGGLYRFFPDKQAILDAIAVRRVEEFQGLVQERLTTAAQLDGPGLLALMLDLYVDFLDRHPDFRAIALGRHVSALTRENQVGLGSPGPAGMLAFFLPGADADLKLRIAIEAGERLIDYAFEQTEPEARARVIQELKRLLTGYLFDTPMG